MIWTSRLLLHGALTLALGLLLATRSLDAAPPATDDLAALSDEFDRPASLADWQNVNTVEQWNAEQLERVDIGTSNRGDLTMLPYTSGWYREYRGVLLFKLVTGDFDVTSRVTTSNRRGNGAPNAQFSLAGLMIRTPRAITPTTRPLGGENYIFASIGVADRPGNFSFEVKTTRNSDSTLRMIPTTSGSAELRVVRLGAVIISLTRPSDSAPWVVLGRYHRPDMPATLQVGMTSYTDWPGVERLSPEVHNRTVIRTGNPDLVARYSYVRFARPRLPAALVPGTVDFSNPASVSDADLVRYLATGDRPTYTPAATASTVAASPAVAPTTTPLPVPPVGAAMPVATPAAPRADDLKALSDEFDDARSAANWRRVAQTEGWNIDVYKSLSINRDKPGKLVIVPWACSWYQEYRADLVYKEVQGDFVATAQIAVTDATGKGAPNSQYSLCGIMVRTPRAITPATWTPAGENYIFLSVGAANRPGTFQFEVKTTVDSRSTLAITDGAPSATLRTVRLGSAIIVLQRPQGGQWTVHRRYARPDMPARLQVGICTYADWDSCSKLSPTEHNRTVIRNGNPDMIAAVDYLRFARPVVPAGWQDRDPADPASLSDADVLAVFGEAAD